MRVLSVLIVAPAGCKAPPTAPRDLEQLAGWIYGKVRDGSDDELTIGVNNLETWLRNNYAEAEEGYRINELDRAVANAADGRNPDLSEVVGAAVADSLPVGPPDVAWSAVYDDPMEIHPDTYISYERDWVGDVTCFPDASCAMALAWNTSENQYPLGVRVKVEFGGEYRWVDTDAGPAIVQRTWLTGPADINVDWLSVDYQYFLAVTMPYNGMSRRLQATWIGASLGDAPIPENVALKMVVNSMIQADEDLAAWLDR